MMIFVPSTIETFDKLPDVQVGPDADAITVIPNVPNAMSNTC